MNHEPSPRRSSCFRYSCFILLAVLQFCLFLDRRDITSAHEGRVASTAREMLVDHDWIVPHSNGHPRIVKPPLPYWAAAIAWKIAGSTDVWLARLPAALCGAIAVVLVMDLGRRILGRGGDVVAGVVWVGTWFVVDEYRKAMADPYLAFFTLLSVWSWIVADQRRAPGRPGGIPPQRETQASSGTMFFLLLAYGSAAAGGMAKGHLAIIHLLLAIGTYHLVRRRRPPGKASLHVVGIALMLLLALPWFVYVFKYVPDTLREWQEDASGANATLGPKHAPIYQYFINLPLTAAPWSVLLIVGALTPWFGPRHRRRDRRHLWPLAWLGASVLVFSLVPMKKNTYLLPAMPAQTLIIAAPIVQILRSRRHNMGDRLLFAGHAIAASAALCAVLGIVLASDRVAMEPPGPILAAAAIGIFILVGARSLSPRLISMRTFVLTAVAFALAVHGYESWLWPDLDNRRSDRAFAQAAVTRAGDLPLCVIGEGLREDVLFYLGRTLPVYRSPDRLPADYHGYAMVTADAMRAHLPGDVVARSADRPGAPQDRLILLRIPSDPALLQLEHQR